MPTSKSTRRADSLEDLALGLCWGAWTELGVSGWRRTHQEWAIDPEPLIVFTAWMGDVDRRLRDESLDWCIHYWRHVSKVRLKNLPSRHLEDDLHEAWGEYAATVNTRARVAWPRPTDALARYQATGRSTLRSLTEPSLVCLRMRAMFGLGARTEIMRQLLFQGDRWMTVARLASTTAYAKRNVADECDTLERAGVLAMRAESNRFYYSLAHADALADFVGDLPSVRPDWRALFDLLAWLIELERHAERLSDEALHIEMHSTMREIDADLDALGFERPTRASGLDYRDTFLPWADALLSDLAAGRWPSKEKHQD
ncbi:MAG TPA: hypothetical protein VGA62_05220 [Acidimicrobiia bacterium]